MVWLPGYARHGMGCLYRAGARTIMRVLDGGWGNGEWGKASVVDNGKYDRIGCGLPAIQHYTDGPGGSVRN